MKSGCPYGFIQREKFWNASLDRDNPEFVPQLDRFVIVNSSTKIASAGSCFAQHIARDLKTNGFSYLNCEPGPEWIDEDTKIQMGYGLYSARFGNIYTTVQLEQLISRVYGRFIPEEDHWLDNSAYFDPFRPSIQPGGFQSIDQLHADREAHFAAVRSMFKQLEVFVFTLGLTEAWRSKADGAVFPVCPGCEVGNFDPDRYEFVNFTLAETVAGLERFLDILQSVNQNAKVILTVSPVPLTATYSERHILEATTYSKSVLRVAAEDARNKYEQVSYFASYELVTSGDKNTNFDKNLKGVSDDAVNSVMNAFYNVFCDENTRLIASRNKSDQRANRELVCDEDKLVEALAVHSC